MKTLTAGLAALSLLTCATPLAAQGLPDPEGVLVEELIVRAKEPGPAWWRVKDADTTVWILGVAEDQLPPGVTWDDRYLQRRLKGTNQLILGNRIALQGGLRDVPAMLKARATLRSKTPLSQRLGSPLRERYVIQRDRLGKAAAHAEGWNPAMAGMILATAGPKSASITDAVAKSARRAKVKTVTPATYNLVPFLRSAMATLTPALEEQCLDLALTDLEAPPGATVAAARAWAEGDVANALRGPRGFDKCVLLLGGGETLWRRAVDDNAAAIVAALKTPGHAVALVGLRNLLAEDGVAAKLEARGVEVLSPGDP